MAAREASVEVAPTLETPAAFVGAQRWLVVLASWLQHFVILGTLYSSGLYILPMAREFDVGRGAVAWVGSMWYGLTIFWSLPAAMLPDKIGLRLVSFGCAVLTGCGLVGSAEARELWVLYLVSVVIGLGLSCISNAGVMIQPWFPEKRGRATGAAMTGSGAGNFVYALALQAVITAYEDDSCSDEEKKNPTVNCDGWRWALRYESALSFGLLAIASLMAARPAAAPRTIHAMRRLTLAAPSSDTVVNPVADVDMSSPVRVSTSALLKTPCARAMMVYWFCAGFGYLNVFAHFAAHAEDTGVDKWDAALLLSLMGLSSVCGRVVLGLAADRFNRVHILSATCFILALTAAVWPAADSFGGLVVIALMYGFFAGGIPSLPPTIAADYYGQRFGSRLFVLYSCAFVFQLPGTVVGPPICGWIYDSARDYYGAGAFSAVALVLAAVSLLTIPPVDDHTRLVDSVIKGESDSLGSERPSNVYIDETGTRDTLPTGARVSVI